MAESSVTKTDWNSVYLLTVVAFLTTLHMFSIIPIMWPYLQKMDPSATENFYGWLRSMHSLGMVAAVVTSGWLANHLLNTKVPLLVSRVVAVASCLVFLCIETYDSGRRTAFIVFELLFGIQMGASHAYKAHIAAVSTEADRSKAIAMTSLAPAIGIFLTPIGQAIFNKLGYPGIPLPFGVHMNLFTAPIMFAIAVSTSALFLLLLCFDGRMPVTSNTKGSIETKEKIQSADESVEKPLISDILPPEASSSAATPARKYDLVAVLLCFFTKMVIGLTILHFSTIGSPYTMMTFKFTSAEAVMYQSAMFGLVGLMAVAWNTVYVFCNLRSKLSERRAVVCALFAFAAVYMVSYPWFFYAETIGYREVEVNASSIVIPTSVQETANEDRRFLGCHREYEWCATTPRVNMFLYYGSTLLGFGIAIPLCMLNLDILYSKVLGPIPQGTMQGWYIACGEVLNIFGPVILSKVYTLTGPVHLWQFQIAVVSTCIFLWFFFYKRMVSITQRPIRVSQDEAS
ncbi:Protein W03C9.6 [Aphelenchoides avenae]|nr:Protein W03C9.6 [Aphelenchus avenae]